MRVISFKKLKDFFETPGNEDSEIALRAWNDNVEHAQWKTHADLKRDYPTADYVGNNRYVFNIKGNTYRLVVVVIFNPQWVLVRWVGRHKDYDKIDSTTTHVSQVEIRHFAKRVSLSPGRAGTTL